MLRFNSTLAVVTAAAAVAAGYSAAFNPVEPPWQQALSERSEALNRQYDLGARASTQAATPGWMHALEVRSDALNRQHGLGKYAG
jgi:hypothetical protein